MGGSGAGEGPGGDVGEEICEDEVDGGVFGGGVVVGGDGGSIARRGSSSVDVFPFACCCCCCCRLYCIRIAGAIFIDEAESQCLVDLAFEFGGRSAGAGAEVYEGVVFYRGAEDGLEVLHYEAGGGDPLEGREVVGPEEGECGLHFFAEEGGEPGCGQLDSVGLCRWG